MSCSCMHGSSKFNGCMVAELHNISHFFTVSGEAADVLEEAVAGWHERPKILMDGLSQRT